MFIFKFYYIIIHSTLLTHKILADNILFISNTHYIKLRIKYIFHTGLFKRTWEFDKKECKQSGWHSHIGQTREDLYMWNPDGHRTLTDTFFWTTIWKLIELVYLDAVEKGIKQTYFQYLWVSLIICQDRVHRLCDTENKCE